MTPVATRPICPTCRTEMNARTRGVWVCFRCMNAQNIRTTQRLMAALYARMNAMAGIERRDIPVELL